MSAPAPVRPSGSAPVTRAGHRSRFSSVAAKYIMAITGLMFSAYVLVHMIGNLKVYQGPETFNSYAHWLRNAFYPVLPYEGLLWILRVVLVVSVIAHIVCALILKSRARRARGGARAPSIRRRRGLGLSVFAGRSMLVTGVVLLLFVIFHVLDLTTGTSPAAPDGFQAATHETSHAYSNLVDSFSRWPASLIYIAAMVALALHLLHGLVSAVYDMGVGVGSKARNILSAVALLVALVVALGNITIPVAVLTGLIS